MTARGFSTPRASAHISTALSVALAGLSIGLATPAYAAPEGPDRVEETRVDQQRQTAIVDAVDLGAAPLARSRVLGVPPGLLPLRPTQELIFLNLG